MRAQINGHDYEQLSAYIDGQLAAADRRKLEERLHLQPDLQAALDELTRTRALLRTAPRRRAPRNFTLTPAMVGSKPPRRVNNFLNLFPTLSFASGLAALALVISVVFQLLPGSQAANTMATAPQADTAALRESVPAPAAGALPAEGIEGPAAESAPAAEAPAQAKAAASAEGTAPPVITWGDPNAAAANGAYGMGMGGGGGGGAGAGPSTGALLGPPGCPDGRCGGAPDTVYGLGAAGDRGTGGGAISGTLVIPAPSLTQSQSAEPGAAAQEAPQDAVQPNPSISGPGPILGVPAGDMSGQIIEQKSIQGQPVGTFTEPDTQSPLASQPRLLLIQVLLGAVALITGAAAFLVRRSRAG